MRRTFLWVGAVWLLFSSALPAQAPPVEGAAEPSGGTTLVRPLDMPVEQFRLLLVPRTKQELEQDAAQWQEALQQKATAIARARVIAKRTSDPSIPAQISQLSGEQDNVAARLRLVIDALEAKGGDVAELRAYLTSVTSPNVLENPSLVTSRIGTWLTSPEGGRKLGLKLLGFVAALLIARIIARIVGGLIERMLNSSKVKVTELLSKFFVHTSRNAVMALGLVVGLSVLGVPVGPFLAAMGAVGFIVGFALQDTLGNFASGVMILLYRPYDLDDFVQVAGVTGKVNAMTLVSTTLLTGDNQLVVVPNKSIWGGIITNITGNSTRRVDLTFGIGYDDDIRQAQAVLEKLVASHPLVLDDPEPVVRVHELADSSVNFICRPWVKTADYWSVHWDLTRMVKETFDAEGISIPFPQQDVHMHPAPPEKRAERAA